MTATDGTPFGSGLLLGERIGAGASGEVRRATVRATGEAVAVKLLRHDLADDPMVAARFLQEAAQLKQLRHPALVRMRDLVLEDGQLGIVMDLVPGGDLRAHLRAHGRLRPAEACALLAPVCEALAVVHAAGVLHRDVKPENVLLDAAGNPLLSDLGVARLAGSSALTTHTSIVGTPHYLAPEAAEGRPVAASDVYGVGAVLFELLAGEPPFGGGHPVAVLRRHLEDAPPVLAVDPALVALLDALLAKDPAARPGAADAAARLRSLATDLAGQPALVGPLPTPLAATATTVPGATPTPAGPLPGPAPSATALPVAGDLTVHRPLVRPVPAADAPAEGRDRKLWWAAAAAAVLLVGGGGAAYALSGSDSGTHPSAGARPSPSLLLVKDASGATHSVPATRAADGSLHPTQVQPPGTSVLPPDQQQDSGSYDGGGTTSGGGGTSTGGGGTTTTAGGTGTTTGPAPTVAPTRAPTTAPTASPRPSPRPSATPKPPTQPPAIPGAAGSETSRRCSSTRNYSESGNYLQLVSCIGYVKGSDGVKHVRYDVYVREYVRGTAHHAYGSMRPHVQLLDGTTVLTTFTCTADTQFAKPASSAYWTRCGTDANKKYAGKGLHVVGYASWTGPTGSISANNGAVSPKQTV